MVLQINDDCSENQQDLDVIEGASSVPTSQCARSANVDKVKAKEQESEILVHDEEEPIGESSIVNSIEAFEDKEAVWVVDQCKNSQLDIKASGRSSVSFRSRKRNENYFQQNLAGVSCGFCCWCTFIVFTMVFFWPFYLTALFVAIYAPLKKCYRIIALSLADFRQLPSRQKNLSKERISTDRIGTNGNSDGGIVME